MYFRGSLACTIPPMQPHATGMLFGPLHTGLARSFVFSQVGHGARTGA